MRTKTTTGLIAVTLTLTLTSCGSSDESTEKPATKPTATEANLSPEALASARAAADLPSEPDAKTRQAYLDALNAIDPRIIKPGKEDQAVSRGINQCSSIRTTEDEARLAQTALQRFTVDTRLPDIASQETGRKINQAVHTHLCPDF
ncbi:hypothetical protein ACIRSU_18550 [Streptomyces sp. NPDC101160]|uniref:hypothetical protein n=1 Tax=Streptomyces sp. NPDC101160 TaxID=3366118 RepID=UPI003806F6ED